LTKKTEPKKGSASVSMGANPDCGYNRFARTHLTLIGDGGEKKKPALGAQKKTSGARALGFWKKKTSPIGEIQRSRPDTSGEFEDSLKTRTHQSSQNKTLKVKQGIHGEEQRSHARD